MLLGCIKGIGKTAPARILCQDLMFFRGGKAILRFYGLQNLDRGNVLLELGFFTAHADLIVGDAVVVLFVGRYFGMRIINGNRLLRLCSFREKCGGVICFALRLCFFGFCRNRFLYLYLLRNFGRHFLAVNGELIPYLDQPLDILVCRVLRNPAHGNPCVAVKGTAGHSEFQYLCNRFGIPLKELIEIPDTYKSDAFGKLLFELSIGAPDGGIVFLGLLFRKCCGFLLGRCNL